MNTGLASCALNARWLKSNRGFVLNREDCKNWGTNAHVHLVSVPQHVGSTINAVMELAKTWNWKPSCCAEVAPLPSSRTFPHHERAFRGCTAKT
ncbi:hypothetical protein PAXRUDRAFT_831579 [Paxillus rubicundulus Ve08.2h10]|uniref:Uncharacterized protein n=1 Tax=Paxillus rubicundulus Ve08.2h10 TaxID=930991 RepID=A0A0D0DRT2_9AGAM|nr:hypothetical protein PAXRUDRAFT_831579 [Paxillus rubicundulus Ve08.2h10]